MTAQLTNYIEIHDQNGVRTIDMAPVDELLSFFQRPREGRLVLPVDFLTQAKKLDHEQRYYLLAALASMTAEYMNLFHSCFEPKFRSTLDKIDELRQHAANQGFELWPELPAGMVV